MAIDTKNQQFWSALLLLCDDKIRHSKHDSLAIHEAVEDEVNKMLNDKSREELEAMQKAMQKTLAHPDEGIDVEYWDVMLKRVEIFKARAIVHETIAAHPLSKEEAPNIAPAKPASPQDQTTLDKVQPMFGSMEEQLYQEVSKEPFEEGEEVFAEEVILPKKNQQLIKPKFVNRVFMGYEWTRYNQAHYDSENPPPKMVKGYKFNIFYPELKDKSNTPGYTVERSPDSDMATIRFSAGPPYQDIAFKIENREWEKSHRRGFRCTFEKGVLRLHFQFKKFKYRR